MTTSGDEIRRGPAAGRMRVVLGALLAVGVACLAATASAQTGVDAARTAFDLPKGNVVANPGAELAGEGTGDAEKDIRPWVSTHSPPGGVTFGRSRYYTTSGVHDPTAGKLGGWYFLSPGVPGATTAMQDVRLSAEAALAIADWHTGRVTALLGAWVGGWQNESGYGGVVVQFLSGRGTQIGKSLITEPVDADAWRASTFVHRTASAFVPPGTRTIRVMMKAVAAGPYGLFFDDVSLTLGYEELSRDAAEYLMKTRIRSETTAPGCTRSGWSLELATVSAARDRTGYRVEGFLEQRSVVGNDLKAQGKGLWHVRTKEDVRALNALARYVDRGCPTPNPPGMTPRR